MDNNFVRDMAYKEPLLGIKENVWRFTTKERKQQKQHAFTSSATGLLRLTSIGTRKFDKLSQGEQTDFFNNLLKELSDAVPVQLSRLTTNRTTKLDKNFAGKRYLISIDIIETRNEYDNSVATIINFIDTMVRRKDQTPIGLGRVTRYLDKSYGFKKWRKYLVWMYGFYVTYILIFFFCCLIAIDDYKDSYCSSYYSSGYLGLIIGPVLYIALFFVLYLLARRRDSNVTYTKTF
jgi:hypothetical protein